ncbi:hypothetical protein [Streptomyces sp. NPDC048057]|uniref:alpha/beta hydrolase family protein n=1 Tax=Streptomyces sp. NPDC048057 TaxID=3155628 RepID=UPI0033CD7B91
MAGSLVLAGIGGLAAPAAATTSASTNTSASTGAAVGTERVRGALVSYELQRTFTRAQVVDALTPHVATDQVRHGVSTYLVKYRTVDHRGAPVVASQLVALPDNGDRSLPVVSWLHGTTVTKTHVASARTDTNDHRAALLFASTGRAVSAPDYVGLGKDSPGRHPYGDPRATVAAGVDGLRSAREAARDLGRRLERNVQISGFSQGGPAAMLMGRALQQEGADRYFRLGALAPVGGPFDLSTFEKAAADDAVEKSGLYLAYFATAWNWMYGGLYDSPSDAFKAPYDAVAEELFNGAYEPQEILAKLTPASRDLFTPQFLEKVRNPTGDLARRLRQLDTTCDWRPEVPVRIFHAKGDKDVDFAHARHCAAQLAANGAAYGLTDVGPYDHNGSVRQALPQVVRFFDAAAGRP